MKTIGLIIIIFGLLFQSCATMEKPEIQVVKEPPKVSPVIAKAQPDAPKGLKRKLAIARFTNETSTKGKYVPRAAQEINAGSHLDVELEYNM